MPWRRGDGVCSVGVGIRCDVEDENAACTGGDTLLLLLPPPVYAAAVAVVEAHLALGDGPCWESETRGGVAFSGVATKTEWSLRECVQASIGRLSLPPSPPAGLRGKLLVYVQVTTDFSRWPQLACAYLSSQRRPNCNMPYGLNTQRLTRQTPNSRTAAARLHLKERAREKQLVKGRGGGCHPGSVGSGPVPSTGVAEAAFGATAARGTEQAGGMSTAGPEKA